MNCVYICYFDWVKLSKKTKKVQVIASLQNRMNEIGSFFIHFLSTHLPRFVLHASISGYLVFWGFKKKDKIQCKLRVKFESHFREKILAD